MPKGNKNKFSFISILKTAKDFWPFIALAGGFILTIALLPQKVTAVERKVEQVESRTEKVERYILEQEKTQELIRKSPPGWRWNQLKQEFEIDPSYKKAR